MEYMIWKRTPREWVCGCAGWSSMSRMLGTTKLTPVGWIYTKLAATHMHELMHARTRTDVAQLAAR